MLVPAPPAMPAAPARRLLWVRIDQPQAPSAAIRTQRYRSSRDPGRRHTDRSTRALDLVINKKSTISPSDRNGRCVLMPGFCCKGTYHINGHAEGLGALVSSKRLLER
jgi:hypothetical protein